MGDDRDLIGAYRRLRASVERERTRQRREGRRADQRFLRRSRLCADIDLRTLKELLRELEAFEI